MRIFITGGAGFIGSHLTELLLARGDVVVALDNLSTGSRANIAAFEGHERYRLEIADGARGGALLETLCEEADAVVHLASAVGVEKIMSDPLGTLDTNIECTRHVLNACGRFKRRLIVASTSEVYGQGLQSLFNEADHLLIGPPTSRRWCYAASKLLDEFLALAHWFQEKLPVTVVRLFNTVGPRQTGRYGMVIPRLVGQALRGEPMTIFGNGEQRRTFADVRQVVKVLAELLSREAAVGQVINIGGTAELSINELADLIVKLTGSKSKKNFMEYREHFGESFDDMRRRNPDTARLRELLGWSPDRKIEDIVGAVIEDMRARERE